MWLLLMAYISCSSSLEVVDVVSTLNARFRAGTPSDDPASAGVVIHALNPQLGLGDSPWESDASSAQIVSCSIINAQLPFLYHGEGHGIGGWIGFGGGQRPGFVLRSSAVKRALLCSYASDGCTDARLCPTDWRSSDTCVPGCPSAANQDSYTKAGALPQLWKKNSSGIVSPSLSLSETMLLHQKRVARGTRPFEGESPAATLERARLAMQLKLKQYNELVLAADTLNSILPSSAIEAVYMLPRTALIDAQMSSAKAQVEAMNARNNRTTLVEKNQSKTREGPSSLARAVHAHLLRHLNRTAQQLPLLELDMSNPVEPFSRAAT